MRPTGSTPDAPDSAPAHRAPAAAGASPSARDGAGDTTVIPDDPACDDTVDLLLPEVNGDVPPSSLPLLPSLPPLPDCTDVPAFRAYPGDAAFAAGPHRAAQPGVPLGARAVTAHLGEAPTTVAPAPPPAQGLLGDVGRWGPVTTPFGSFRLVPVHIERDLPLVCRWMNDPAVAAFWELAGPEQITERYLRGRLDGDGRALPCLGVLDGTPMSYWELYRADLDPVARYYPARPHDTGLHLLIGGVPDRGHGVGTVLLRAVADLVFDHRADCGRVIAEPDLRNTPSIAAFLSAGFRFSAEVTLPGKRAALMVRDRSLRHLL
ncbi:GNAT family N-acetyltransferase [Streptomyces zagrosensis]|uniref:Lysine N-acyltransferase MbtK n=1 Tax=Streptomyces zagrosensis TaxID=1042984 RepID=A0A7W9UZX7_9ACTN|nr:GNAT family N-acetyltransferase [Streptomyces zagrosensis]MBB5937533.1 RimJ/RimL family protein N-acetyltransferase [Streptomyces zagrosensis]